MGSRRAVVFLGLALACSESERPGDVGGGSGGTGGSGGDLMSYCSGREAPDPDAEALAACDVTEPCEPSLAQLAELEGYFLDDRIGCLLSALGERRVGRYRHETDSTWGNGDAGAVHTLVVHEDGTASYVREAYQCIQSSIALEELPPVAPLRCVLKPPSYFEACAAAIEVLDGQAYPPEGAEAWACAFGDGDGVTPNNLFWFESCESEAPARCE